MENISNQTLASIVTSNHEAAIVLEKYNLDFCCKGKRTLEEACNEKGLSYAQISNEIEMQGLNKRKSMMPFTEMTADELISYILVHHHFYVKQSMPTILGHLEKVANKHGSHYGYMMEVRQLFETISEEMTLHMQKEEQILFPRIKKLEAMTKTNKAVSMNMAFISDPIEMMEHEHDQAGDIMYKIRQLTHQYTAPADACTTFKVCLQELKEFEEDLHRHVHLENNILFPLAKKFFLSTSNN